MTESVNFSSDATSDSFDNFQVILEQKGYQLDYFSNAGDTMLHLAAKKGDLEAIMLGIAWGLNKDAVNKAGNTFLHLAAQKGHLHILEYCSTNGYDLFVRNSVGQTPYHLALRGEKENILQFYHEQTGQLPDQICDHLAALGYSPDILNGHGLVMKAVKANDINALKLIAEYKKEVFYQLDGEPLSTAVKKGNIFIVRFLLQEGVGINEKNKVGNTALQEAFLLWTVPLIELLLSYEEIEVNIHDKKGWAPLHYACEKGALSILESLVARGANVNLLTISDWYDETETWTWDDWDAWCEAPFPCRAPIVGPINTIYSPLALAKEEELILFLEEHGATYFLRLGLGRGWY